MRITDIIWRERYITKFAEKHNVSVAEVEEIFFTKPFIRLIAKGKVRGEDLYAAFSQTRDGRYLIVIFIDKKKGRILPISARDMDESERKYYVKHRQKR